MFIGGLYLSSLVLSEFAGIWVGGGFLLSLSGRVPGVFCDVSPRTTSNSAFLHLNIQCSVCASAT